MDSLVIAPPADRLREVAEVLGSWQLDDGPVQLHPGDLGWFSMRGPVATAQALRVWEDGGELVAVGLLDGPDLLRLAVHPDASEDAGLARQMAADITDPAKGVLPAGEVYVEARGLTLLNDALVRHGWRHDEAWTPLRHHLAGAVEVEAVRGSGLQVSEVPHDEHGSWGEVHWSAFTGTEYGALERARITDWLDTMRSGPLGERVSLLVGRDPAGATVAVAGVWTAGPGRPGLVEPMGVHADHRGKRYGVDICRAAALRLRELGCSSAAVATESANRGAVDTYVAAGFVAGDEVLDLSRR